MYSLENESVICYQMQTIVLNLQKTLRQKE